MTPFPTFPHGGRSWFDFPPLGEIRKGVYFHTPNNPPGDFGTKKVLFLRHECYPGYNSNNDLLCLFFRDGNSLCYF